MAEYWLNKNSEGYADPTAYKAITGMAKPGEIWMYKGREVLVIKNHGTYCNILQLGNYKKDSVEVAGMYAQPGMISYAFNDLLTEYERKISNDELNAVLEEVEDALCLDFVKEADSMAHKYDEQYKNANIEAEKYKIQLEMMKQMYSDLMEKFLQRA